MGCGHLVVDQGYTVRGMWAPTRNKCLPERSMWPHFRNSGQRNVAVGKEFRVTCKEHGSGHVIRGPGCVVTCWVQAVWPCIHANGQSDGRSWPSEWGRAWVLWVWVGLGYLESLGPVDGSERPQDSEYPQNLHHRDGAGAGEGSVLRPWPRLGICSGRNGVSGGGAGAGSLTGCQRR